MRARGVVLAMLVVAGCGSDSGSDPAEATGYRGCTTGDVAGQGKVVAKADLDGADGPETVRLIGATDRRCGNSLVADVGGRLVGTGGGRPLLVPQGAEGVRLGGKGA